MRGRTISHYGSPGPGLRASASESDVAFQAPAASNFSRPLRSYEQPPPVIAFIARRRETLTQVKSKTSTQIQHNGLRWSRTTA